ncbi:MAG: anti-sigma factor antagonist [Chloroflexi bacterium]|nr:anti-sigma factor antagonist [Chloroflexota bacterium]
MTEVRKLTVRGQFRSIPTIIQFVSDAARAAGLDEKSVSHVQLAVDEACTNIIEHAYGGEDNGDIEVCCTIDYGHCQIEIVDYGESFDPDAVPEPVPSNDISEIEPGGLGLHLMRRLMDEVTFSFDDSGNTVTMVKKQPEGAQLMLSEDIPVFEATPNIWVVAPMGRLDSMIAPQLEDLLDRLLAMGRVFLVVDMHNLNYISSQGLKILVTTWRGATNAGGDVVLCGLNSRIEAIFDTVGFSQIFSIYDSRDAAVAALADVAH